MENFGVYKGDNDLIYFDINDFDESTLGPCTYDLTRFISSLYLSSDILGLKTKEMDELASFFLKEFSKILAQGKAKVIEEPCAHGIILHYFKQIEARTKKILVKDWMEEKGDKLRLKKGNPRILPIEESVKTGLFQLATQFLNEYYPNHEVKERESEKNPKKSDHKKSLVDNRIHPLDAAFRLAGTGSLGLNRFIVPVDFEGKIKLLDIKESQSPSINQYEMMGPKWPSDAERICSVQEMMQGTSPNMLSPKIFEKKAYVIRELQPEVDKLNLLEIKSNTKKIQDIIGEMALLVASAFLRSSGWKTSSIKDELQTFGLRTDWQASVLDYGKKYTVQVQKDYEAFKKDFESQKIKPTNSKKTEPILA